MLRRNRLSSKFLLITVPAVVFSALVFVLVSFLHRVEEREQINRQLAAQQAAGHASLLSYPIWNLDEQTVRAILASLTELPRVHCVDVEGVVGMGGLQAVGRCDALSGLWAQSTPIVHIDHEGEHPVGVLRQWVDTSVGRSEVLRDLGPLLLQLVLLVIVLVLTSLWAFARTVHRPLAQVADSLRAFRERGEREAVKWTSQDELGEFIREYNAGLERQEYAERALRAQLNFLTALQQTMPIPFAYLGENLRLCDANPAFHHQLGIGREALGQSMAALVPAVHWSDVLALAPGAVHTQELRGFAVRGSEHGFSLACSPFLDADGQVRGHVLVLQDITERLANEAALRAAVQRSEATLAELHRAQASLLQSEKLAALGGLVAGVAHEINTPLGNSMTVATRIADLLERLAAQFESQQLKRSELAQFIRDARDGTELLDHGLQAVGEQVRRFRQVAVSQGELGRQRFELAALVHEVARAQQRVHAKRAPRIDTDVPEGLFLDGLPGTLVRVLEQCIDNAIIHGFHTDHPADVQVSVHAIEGEWVRIDILDHGRGMPDEHLRRVFDPFFTTHLGQGGGGLGMSVVYRLVHDVLRGRIALHSRLGEGTRVRIELPLDIDAAERDLNTAALHVRQPGRG